MASAYIFCMLDMSEYMERHSVAKLIGAPPGTLSWTIDTLVMVLTFSNLPLSIGNSSVFKLTV